MTAYYSREHDRGSAGTIPSWGSLGRSRPTTAVLSDKDRALAASARRCRRTICSIWRLIGACDERLLDEDFGHRRRRLHRLGRWCGMLVREHGHDVLNVDKLTYAASPEALEEVGSDPRYRLLRGRHLRPRRGGARPSPSSRPTRSCISRPRAMSTARSTGRAPSSRPTSSAPTCMLDAALRLLAGPAGAAARGLPLRPCVDRRGLRLARARGQVHREPRATTRTRPMPRARPPPTIWRGPGTGPTACR